ncbi:MAG: 2-oxoacid:acceptor oxidoreductase family protein, partial [Candidatus Bathyarchaeia archaeon]
MVQKPQSALQFCGFGGQGIILATTVLGDAAVRAGLNAVQTQSFGAEARGGECQAQLIIAPGPIFSPVVTSFDVLVALSKPALNRYLPRLKNGGLLIIDPHLVNKPARFDITIYTIPATFLAATHLGQKIVANMIILGCLQQITSIV